MIDEFVFKLKYARYNEKEKRRETWSESVYRYTAMLKRKFPSEIEEIENVEDAILEKRILPSMRGLQFGGDGIERKNMRMYNCTSSFCDRPRFFAEALWLLLCGSGVGFSVQKHHVASLPTVRAPEGEEFLFIVPDSIEGWADAVNCLIMSYLGNYAPVIFDFSEIRPAGAPLSVGGTAPSYKPLKKALDHIEPILQGAVGRQLKPIEAFDIVMHLANCTVTAGTRRSATIALFSVDDDEMMTAKTGEWYVEHSHRARANISAVVTPDVEKQQFMRLFDSTKQFGEPAFVFLESTEHCVNPCVEIAMCPVLITKGSEIIDSYTLDLLDPSKRAEHIEAGYHFASGWQACNLSSINVSAAESKRQFIEAAALAAQLGTYQASFTETGYLGQVSQNIIEREALLGVSLCGILSNPEIATDGKTLQTAALTARERNRSTAIKIGINRASRVTCVKPEGTASLVLNTSSGIHPAHAPMYLRRIQCAESESVFQHFRATNPQAIEKSVWGSDYCVIFPMRGEGRTKKDVGAFELLKLSAHIKRHWIFPTTDAIALEGASHNVSLTAQVQTDEWEDVAAYIWENRTDFTGVSLLSATGDYDYEQAPLQAVSPERTSEKEMAAWELWQRLQETMKNVEYDSLIEHNDTTTPLASMACAGGSCELK